MSPPKTTSPAVHEAREINLVPDIYGAVQWLCIRATPEFSEKELEWLARCGDGAEVALQNMSDAVEFIGCRMASGEASGDEDVSGIPSLLHILAESMRGIHALVFLRGFVYNQMRFREDAR